MIENDIKLFQIEKDKLNTSENQVDFSDQLKVLEGDEVLAATIESLRITEYQTNDSTNSTDLIDSSTEYSNGIDRITSKSSSILKLFLTIIFALFKN
jgi:hypothetical protein